MLYEYINPANFSATSALDAASEMLVQESIDSLNATAQHTTIAIAHRLTTIRNATKIAVIDKGAVVELGAHDSLLEKSNGLYAMLWAKQQRTAEKEGVLSNLFASRESSVKILNST